MDLTVSNADEVRDFYAAVVGWQPEAVDMGEYADYSMVDPESGEPICGVCHARGQNADLPPVWLMYIVVEDLDASLATCVSKGGHVVLPARGFGGMGRFAVIRDPGGAHVALTQYTTPQDD